MNYYEVLGINHNASQTEIKNAYKKLAKLHHPDVNPNQSDRKMSEISEAYHTLSDPYRRQVYDSKLFIGTVRNNPSTYRTNHNFDEMKDKGYSRTAYFWGFIFILAFFAIVAAGSIWIVRSGSENQYEKALLAYQEKKFDEALYHLDESIQWLGENNTDAALLAGKILLQELNAPETALEYLDKGLRYANEKQTMAELYQMKGMAFQRLGKEDQAEASYKKAAELNPAADTL